MTAAILLQYSLTARILKFWHFCRFSKQCTTHTHPFNGPLPGTTWVSRYQKGKTNLEFTEARDSEWQCHQLGHMQVCISLQTDHHASFFYRPDALPATQPTASKHWRQCTNDFYIKIMININVWWHCSWNCWQKPTATHRIVSMTTVTTSHLKIAPQLNAITHIHVCM